MMATDVLLVLSSLCLISGLSSYYGDPLLVRDSTNSAPENTHDWSFLALGDTSSYVLPRLEGVQVGHKQEVELLPNKTHFRKTLSLKPLAFEIPDFLTEDECKILIQLAKRKGLKKSLTSVSKERAEFIEKLAVNQMEIFNFIDLNQDGQLQITEMLLHERFADGQWLTPEDFLEMYNVLKADPDGNGVLSLDEFKGVNILDFYKYMDRKKANKIELVRNSQQVWLDQGKMAHPIIPSIYQRVIHLSHLPPEMVEFSERLEVAHYSQGGYYHAHRDSDNAFLDVGCAHTRLPSDTDTTQLGVGAVCRYATVLIYLNNVTGGGETIFPIADNRTYDELSLIQNNIDLRDMSRNCDKGNLRIKPVQGTAIFWYNHLPDGEGWIGHLDDYSLHGGCLVTGGTKWIATQWINADPNKDKQLLFQKWKVLYANDNYRSVDNPDINIHEEL